MSNRKKYRDLSTPGQLFSFARDSYLDRTCRPIYALTYLVGFIIFYELGTVLINPEILNQSLTEAKMVVSFVWVQGVLRYLGFSQRMTWVVTPMAVVLILLSLQITSRTRWYVNVLDFIPMTIECIVLVLPLIVLSMVMNRPAAQNTAFYEKASIVKVVSTAPTDITRPPESPDNADGTVFRLVSEEPIRPGPGLTANIVTGIGAGIYEELIFRLVLVCLLMLLFQDLLHFDHTTSVVFSVLIAALLFSAHHHIFYVYGQFRMGEPFTLSKFVFRTLAGMYFAALFAVRGFGITAGAHAFYNIIAAVLNYC